jgi:hypothetical protein
MIKTRLAFCLMIALLASGCFASREERIQQLKTTHPQWDQGSVEKVVDRRVEIGMTEEMAREGMGRPWSVRRDGDVTIWEYSRFRMDSEGTSLPRTSFFVHFRNGKVIGTQGDLSATR